jgi:hypothetical protein
MNSRNKGKRGELEAAKFLASEGFPARRGQQFSGGTDSPDVVCEALPGIHFEVKRTEKGNPYDWVAQAERDAGHKIPVVLHRAQRPQMAGDSACRTIFADCPREQPCRFVGGEG